MSVRNQGEKRATEVYSWGDNTYQQLGFDCKLMKFTNSLCLVIKQRTPLMQVTVTK